MAHVVMDCLLSPGDWTMDVLTEMAHTQQQWPLSIYNRFLKNNVLKRSSGLGATPTKRQLQSFQEPQTTWTTTGH